MYSNSNFVLTNKNILTGDRFLQYANPNLIKSIRYTQRALILYEEAKNLETSAVIISFQQECLLKDETTKQHPKFYWKKKRN